MTTLRAHFDGKAFVPDEPVDLPQGTQVTVTVVPDDRRSSRSALQDLADLAQQHPITDAPEDWSEQHDHYIHGAPKK